MLLGRLLRINSALILTSLFLIGCSVNDRLQGYIGRGNSTDLTITAPTIAEGSTGQIDLTLLKTFPTEIVISYSSVDVTAEDSSDYTAISGTVTFAAGSTIANIAIAAPANEGMYEGNETFSVNFTVPPTLKVTGTSRTVTITDAQTQPTVQFAAGTSNAPEATTPHLVNVTLTGVTQSDVTVNYTVTSTGATGSGTDFTLASGVLTFASPSISEDFSIAINPDVLPEDDETFSITLSSPTVVALGTTTSHIVTIQDDDLLPFTWMGKSGVDNNWSTAANWSTNAVPGNTDVAIFNSACTNGTVTCAVTINAAVDVSGIDMQSSYIGIITQGAFDVTVGTGDFVMAGGTFNAANGRVIEVAGDFSRTAGTFNPGTGTVRFTGSANATITTNATAYYNFEFRKGGAAELTLSGDVSITNNFIHTVEGASGPTSLGDDYLIYGSIYADYVSGWAAGSSSALILIGASNHTVSTSSVFATVPRLKLNTTGNVTFTSSGPNQIVLVDGFEYINASVVTTTGTDIIFDGHAMAIKPGPIVFNNVLIALPSGNHNNIDGTLIVGGNLDLEGVNSATQLNGGTVAVAGNVRVINGYVGGGSTNIILNGTSDQTITQTAGTFPGTAITVNKSGGKVLQATNVNIATHDIVFQQAGTWDLAGYNLTADDLNGTAAAGTFWKTCGTLTKNSVSGTINEYNGTEGVTLSIANAADVTENDLTNVDQLFVVSVTPQNCAATTFDFATTDNTAVAPGDYTAITTTSTNIPANTSSITLTVVTKFDDLAEGNENYTVTLSNLMAGVTAGTITGSGTILDDDTPPTINVGDLNVIAGNPAAVVVSLAMASGTNVTFNYATSDGTALAPGDYAAVTATAATITAGQTSVTLAGIPTQVGGVGKNFNVTISGVVNATAGDLTGVVTLIPSTPTPIYRSVGPGNTAILAQGGANGMTIAGGVATFASTDLPNNIGVGDAIYYDADDNGARDAVIFVHGRTDARNYTVRTAAGATPVDLAVADQDWRIYRAYTSLDDIDTGTENLSIGVDFDTFTNGKNLITANEQWNIAFYADATFTENPYYDTWTTDKNHYVKFFAPNLSTEVGVSQRHTGSWSTTAAKIVCSSSFYGCIRFDGNTWVDGLLIENTYANGSGNVIGLYLGGDQWTKISNNIIRNSGGGVKDWADSGALVDHSFGELYVYNNIIYNFGSGIYTDYAGQTAGAVYNNTVVNAADTGIVVSEDVGNNNIHVKNNIVVNSGTAYFLQNPESTSNNISDDATSPDVAYRNKTITFIDSANGDYRLASTDIEARNNGVDLSADPAYAFTTDISGTTRGLGGIWDIGAYEAATAIYRSVGPGNTGILAQGSTGPNNLTITGTSATFATGIANNIGVGDIIIYSADGTFNSADNVAYIHGRTNNATYTVASVSGVTPTAYAANQNWRIYRAYTSLANAENGTKNTAVTAILGAGHAGLDQWTGGRDLVANNEQWNIALYADAMDVAPVTIAGWTTGDSKILKVFSPTTSLEVGVSQRHSGKLDSSKAILSSTAVNLFVNQIADLVVDGVQFQTTHTTTANSSTVILGNNSLSKVLFINNIVTGSDSTGTNNNGIVLGNTSSTADVFIINNIVSDYAGDSANNCIGLFSDFARFYVYNNTVVGCGIGMFSDDAFTTANITLKNNISSNVINAGFVMNPPGPVGNLSSDASSPNASLRNKTVSFNNIAAKDYRLALTDTAAKDAGADLSADPVYAFTTDINGTTRGIGGAWDIGAHEAATAIYRSVGPGNTSILAQGSTGPNNLTITGTTATFATGIADNIGVGDIIIYSADGTFNSADNVAYIHGRANNTTYTVASVSGAVPTAYAANQNWRIYRAYTTLANAENGIKNTAVTAILGGGHAGLDQWTNGRDLVANSEQWNIALYGDAADTSEFDIDGWTTGKENYIRVFAPNLTSEVGISQRHAGVWNATKARIVFSGGWSAAVSSQTNFSRVDGLQIEIAPTSGTKYGLMYGYPGALSSGSETYISNNIVRATTAYDSYGITMFRVADDTKSFISNNIVYNTGSGQMRIGIDAGDGESYVYNNTVIGQVSKGLKVDCGGRVSWVNNIHQGSTANGDYAPCWPQDVVRNQNNISSDASADDYGSGNQINTTVQFVNPSGDDYRLAAFDTKAKGKALELSSDSALPFTIDIAGLTRSSPWDIGAHEAVTAIYRSVGPSNTTALSSGGGSVALTISGSTATFGSARPENIGVGDAIVYNGNANIAFISGRTSSTVYKVTNVAGGTPTAVAGDTGWAIYRAYTSVANAETGTENTGIPAGVSNFDTWSGGRDLVTNNEQWNIALYGDAADTSSTDFDWTTAAGNFIRVYAPASTAEVGVSQRHSGVWSNTKARLVNAGNVNISPLYASRSGAPTHIRFEGLQIKNNGSTTYDAGLVIRPDSGSEVYVLGNLIERTVTGVSEANGLDVQAKNFGSKFVVANNIINGPWYRGAWIGLYGGGGSANSFVVYNNTIVGAVNLNLRLGSWNGPDATNRMYAANNLVQGGITNYNTNNGDFTAGVWSINNNLSGDGTSPNASLQNKTVTFLDSANGDYRLSFNDTEAKGQGVDLSADAIFPYAVDIAGLARAAPWDIGAAKPAASADYPSLAGLVGLWKFNESAYNSAPGGADVQDFSGSGHYGDESGGVTLSQVGMVGTSYSFDAVDDYVQLPNHADFRPTNEISYGGWFYFNNLGVNQMLIENQDGPAGGWNLEVWSGNLCATVTTAGGLTSACVPASSLATGRWYHIFGKYSSSTGVSELFIDGQQVATESSGSGLVVYSASTVTCLGGDQNNPAQCTGAPGSGLNGRMDEVSIWSRALTATEIQQIYLEQAKPDITIADIAAAEGVGANAVVSIDNAYPNDVIFEYGTGNGTAVAATDYTAKVGQATIPAGQTSVTLPVIPITDDGAAEVAEYFTITLYNLVNADPGYKIVSTVTVVDSTNGIHISNLNTSAVLPNGFDASIDFLGDANTNAVVTLYYCNKTDSPTCNPATSLGSMVVGAGVYTKTVAGLSSPNNPGDTLKLAVVVTDSSGVIGSPLSGEVTLMSTNGLVTGALSFASITDTAFDATLAFNGDADNDASANIYYCNQTDSAGCTPSTLLGLMNRNDGVSFTRSNGPFTTPNDPGDTLKIRVIAADPDGITVSQVDSTVTLAAPSDGMYPDISGLIFRYKLDDATQEHNSSIADSGPNNLTGTLVTNNAGSSKKISPAVVTDGTEFDGVDDRIGVTYNSVMDRGTGDFSTAAWVRPLPNSGGFPHSVIVVVSNGVSLGSSIAMFDDGRIFYSAQDSNAVSAAAVSPISYLDNNWHFVVGVKSGQTGTLNLYVDGVLVASQSTAFTGNFDILGNGAVLSTNGTLADVYTGAMDEATFWGRALSASEIEEIYLRQAPKKIYRSVGPGNTSPIATGTTNAMTITGDTATFASALPDRIGVGDAIQYDKNGDGTPDKIVFITKRNSSTSYRVRTASFATPTGIYSDNSWSIYRAYTSLYDAERGFENIGIDPAVRNFDTWSGGRDLVANNEQWNIALYGDAVDTKGVVIADWVTGQNQNIRIFTPVTLSEVGLSQRHRGVWSDNSYRLVASDSAVIGFGEDNIHLDGVQLKGVNLPDYGAVLIVGAGEVVSANARLKISNSIFTAPGSHLGNSFMVRHYNTWMSLNATMIYWNNIFMHDGTSWKLDVSDGNNYFYNNSFVVTAVNNDSTSVFKNNLFFFADPAGAGGAGTNYNVCSDAACVGGSNVINNQIVNMRFVDAGAGDVRLISADTASINSCVSLANDAVMPFTEDIAGNPRSAQGANWDCGAFEVPEYSLTDNDHTNGEFDAGTKSNVVWNTTQLEITSYLVSERELQNPDTRSFDMTDIRGIWHFNEATIDHNATIVDASGQGLDGVVITNDGASNKSIPGYLDNAMTFDGGDDRVNIGSAAVIDDMSQITVSSWIYVAAGGSYCYDDTIVSKAYGTHVAGWFLGIHNRAASGCYLIFDVAHSTTNLHIESSVDLPRHQWVHVAVTWDGSQTASNAKLFINGVESTYYSRTSGVGSRSSDATYNLEFAVQGIAGGSPAYYYGGIDEVVLFERALSLDEIAALYKRHNEIYNNDTLATFTSRVLDSSDADAKWYDLLPKTPVPYGRSLPISPSINETVQYSGGVNAANLLTYWSLDSGNAIHGTTFTDPISSVQATLNTSDGALNKSRVGKFGEAILFDGSNDYVSIVDNAVFSFNLNQARSFSFWVNPKNLAASTYARASFTMTVSASDFISVDVGSPTDGSAGACTGCVVIYFQNGGNTLAVHSAGGVLKENEWAHVVVAYDGTNPTQADRVRIYVNGRDFTALNDVYAIGALGTGLFNPTQITLGGNPDWPTDYANIELDEVAFWNKALSATEAANLYARGVARLKYQTRTCDDGACSGETWRGFDNTSTSFFDESLNVLKSVFSAIMPFGYDVNRYFQYKVWFESDDPTITPKLEAVEVRGAD